MARISCEVARLAMPIDGPKRSYATQSDPKAMPGRSLMGKDGNGEGMNGSTVPASDRPERASITSAIQVRNVRKGRGEIGDFKTRHISGAR